MATVRDYFAREAGDYLERLDRVVEGMDDGGLDPAELYRNARALRGSAQMAREDAFTRVASALEGASRSVAEKQVAWSLDLSRRVRETLRELRTLLTADAEEAAPIADAAVARLSSVGAAPRHAPAADPASAFREFAARESAGVLGYVEAALKALAVNARDREPLKAVLRRQRALMGAARLPSIPVLAETLTTIDEITRMVARLDVTVENEWLDVYRGARDVLGPLAKSLQSEGEVLPPPALLSLRALRQQLVDRFGNEEAMREPPMLTPQDAATPAPTSPARAAPAGPAPRPVAPPAAPPRAVPPPPRQPAAGAVSTTPAAATGDVASIQDYVYRGDRALGRALELRPALERALATGDAGTAALVAELFDLIELARS